MFAIAEAEAPPVRAEATWPSSPSVVLVLVARRRALPAEQRRHEGQLDGDGRYKKDPQQQHLLLLG